MKLTQNNKKSNKNEFFAINLQNMERSDGRLGGLVAFIFEFYYRKKMLKDKMSSVFAMTGGVTGPYMTMW